MDMQKEITSPREANAENRELIGAEEKQNIHAVLKECNSLAQYAEEDEDREHEEEKAAEADEEAADEANERPIEFDEQTHKLEQSVHTGSTSAISHTLKKLEQASSQV